jgi:hypothetical protein
MKDLRRFGYGMGSVGKPDRKEINKRAATMAKAIEKEINESKKLSQDVNDNGEKRSK